MKRMVDHCLELAQTWVNWDGVPIEVAMDDGPPRLYTPHKAIRRVADHMIDHLAEIEALLAGQETIPDRWHGSMETMPADLAPFTQLDLDEARSRLLRLAQIWDIRISSLNDDQLDAPRGNALTIRQSTEHLTDSDFYADSVGRLCRR